MSSSGPSGTQVASRHGGVRAQFQSQANGLADRASINPSKYDQNSEFSAANVEDGTGRKNATAVRRKRKFPGPAGLLPDLEPTVMQNLRNNYQVSNAVSQSISENQQLQNCIQKSRLTSEEESYPFNPQSSQSEKNQNLLSKHPWRELLHQLELTSEFPNNLIEFMNIDWVITTASQLVLCQKVPFLTVVLQEAPDLPSSKHGQKKTPCVKLLDATGTIEAALDPAFVKLNGSYLQPGTALALKNVGLLRHKRRVILTIAAKNVICMASKVPEILLESPPSSQPQEPPEVDRNLNLGNRIEQPKGVKPQATLETENGVKIFKFCDYSPSRIMDTFKSLTDPKVLRQQYQKLQQDKESLTDGDDLHGNRSSVLGNNSSRTNASRTDSRSRPIPLFTLVSSSSSSSSTSLPLNERGPSNDSESQLQNSEALSNFEFNFDDEDEDDDFFREFDLEVQQLPEQSQPNQQAEVTDGPLLEPKRSSEVSDLLDIDIGARIRIGSETEEAASRSVQRQAPAHENENQQNEAPSAKLASALSQNNTDSQECNEIDFDDFDDEFDRELATFDESTADMNILNLTSDSDNKTNKTVTASEPSQSEVQVEPNQVDNDASDEVTDDDEFFKEFNMELDAV